MLITNRNTLHNCGGRTCCVFCKISPLAKHKRLLVKSTGEPYALPSSVAVLKSTSCVTNVNVSHQKLLPLASPGTRSLAILGLLALKAAARLALCFSLM